MKESECPKELLTEINVLLEEEPSIALFQAVERTRLLAIQRVAQANQIRLKHMAIYPKQCSIEEISQIESFRVRKVTLSPDWWKYDNGHLLGTLEKGKEACALLYKKGHYWLFTKESATPKIVTREIAHLLLKEAYYFYQTLQVTDITLSKLGTFVWPTLKDEVWRLAFFQLMVGLFFLFFPIATAKLFSDVIPNSDQILLIQWTLALFFNVIMITGFNLSDLICEMRLRFKINRQVQSAFWDRVLRLPVNFFKGYTVGDLATRIEAFDRIQNTLSTSVLHGLIQSVFGLITLPLMFYYNATLAIFSAIILFIFAFIYFQALRSNLVYQRQLLHIKGIINGLFIQFINGIGRIRTHHAESRFFNKWGSKFIDSIQVEYKEQMTAVLITIYNAIYPLVLMIVVFALSKYLGEKLRFADFIGFNAALTIFTLSVLGLINNFSKLIDSFTLYERVKPFLTTETEQEPVPYSRQVLSGAIQLDSVNFQISQNQTGTYKILEDLNITVSPGEYIALVGPSGAGKSTIFRLLLGFEQVTSGRILYDGQDLTDINKLSLRHQLGVVLQGDFLFPGTIFENICANKQLSLKEAWKIASLVELDDEIRAMPMGIQTLITEGGKTLSSGQRQRLLIARAISHKPQILLLDEATSMLDNITLSKIHQRLKQEKMTRIVIAQRINTIVNADRIYVIEGGRISQQGTYDQLANKPGWFKQNLDLTSSSSLFSS